MGGYRTPAQLWSLGLLWPASDTLHHVGHQRATCAFPKADGVLKLSTGGDWREVACRLQGGKLK